MRGKLRRFLHFVDRLDEVEQGVSTLGFVGNFGRALIGVFKSREVF